MGDHEGTLENEDNDLSMKTKPILTSFGKTFGTLRFDEKTFLTILGFAIFWDYKPLIAFHAHSSGGNTILKNANSSTINKFHLKCGFY